MRVLHVSTFDRAGGAAIAAGRLHTALRGLGHDSTLLVRDHTCDDPAAGIVALDELACPSASDARLNLALYSIYREFRRPGVDRLFSTDLPSRNIADLSIVRAADVVNVHWTSGMLSVPAVRAIQDLGIPVVWTLHDQATFTGGCHYSGACHKYVQGCEACPYLVEEARHIPALLLRHKARWLDSCRLTVICPSEWLAACARASHLLTRADIHTIANSVPVHAYQDAPRTAARAQLSLPSDAVVVLIGSDRLDEERKGHRHAIAALARLAEPSATGARPNRRPLVCAAFGEGELDEPGLPVVRLGRLTGDEQMALAYRAADIFLLPSLEDNLPNTLLESVAAGTPIVAYATGGITDLVTMSGCGLTVAPGDVDALASAVALLADDPAARTRMGDRAETYARTHLDLEVQGQAYLGVYQRLLERGAASRRAPVVSSAPSSQSFETKLASTETELLNDSLAPQPISARLVGELAREIADHQALIAARGGEIAALRSELESARDQWRIARETLNQAEQNLLALANECARERQERTGRDAALMQLKAERAVLRRKLRRVMTDVVIFGTGEPGRRLWEALTRCGSAHVVAFVDDDERRHGRSFLGVGIHPPAWLRTGTWDLVALPAGAADAQAKLAVAGVHASRVLILPDGDDEALAEAVSVCFPDPLSPALATATARAGIRVGIFGTGAAAMKVWEALADIDQAEAVWFADNNADRQGSRFLWLDVLAPSQIAERGFDAVVIGSMSREPIRQQLRALGIEDARILVPDVGAPTERIQAQLVTALLGTVSQEVMR